MNKLIEMMLNNMLKNSPQGKEIMKEVNESGKSAKDLFYEKAKALGNISTIVQINVPKCCCYTVSIENIGTTALTVDIGNLIIREVK